MANIFWSPDQSAQPDDPARLLLARLFWRASTPLVASLLASACGADGSVPLRENAQSLSGMTMHCVQDGQALPSAERHWRPLSALKLSRDVDYVELRRATLLIQTIDAAGQPCVKASEPRLCEAELRRISLSEGSPNATSHLVVTEGDTVRALRTLEEKLSLLGTIDTPDEALLVLEHNHFSVSCGSANGIDATQVRKRDGGYSVVTHQALTCNLWKRSVVDVAANGELTTLGEATVGTPCPPPSSTFGGGVAGRRPANLLASRRMREPASARARYFARVAHLEAASVPAFEQLAAELRTMGAPETLRRAARAAAEDETRHARVMAQLAERFGARPEPVRLGARRLRGRAEVALDNAIEGCVHETYAAYLATAQARLASEPSMRENLARIAEDETRHAALSWQIADWLEPQLALPVRRYIAAQRLSALRSL